MAETDRARARELGIVVGSLPTGEHNAITDVPGVRVGHTTLIEGRDVRTGVTAIVPDGLTGARSLPAGLAVGNGYGKIVGTTQLSELGVIETPVLLTGTLSTFRVADALVSYMLALPGNEQLETVNPVVAETNDGFLSDMRRRPVTEQHVLAALHGAAAGPVAEGAVGAGTGTGALGFKGGIGTSSRLVARGGPGGPVTIGALVQTNFGGTLTVLGVPVPPDPAVSPDAADPGNSCVIVLATDAPPPSPSPFTGGSSAGSPGAPSSAWPAPALTSPAAAATTRWPFLPPRPPLPPPRPPLPPPHRPGRCPIPPSTRCSWRQLTSPRKPFSTRCSWRRP
jgi:D-aminopeptidase